MSDDFVVYNGIWASSRSVIHEDDYRRQQSYISYIPLEGGSEQITFVYDNDIAAYEEYCETKIKQIRTVDHEVSICDEIYYTTKIEGANTTIARTQDIHNGVALASRNDSGWYSEKMVQNGFRATKFLNLTQNRPLTPKILRQLWDIVTDEVCENVQYAGDVYRNGYVRVGSHEGVRAEDVEMKMNKWLEYFNSDLHNSHIFLKAAILHYTFEDIHPFCDGNGRVGRLLMHDFLIRNGLKRVKAVSFSKVIDATGSRYDLAFVDSQEECGDITPFLKYMGETFSSAIKDCIVQEKDMCAELRNLDESQTMQCKIEKIKRGINGRDI